MKLDILFHYEVDEITGEMKYLGKEEMMVDTSEKKTTKKSTSSSKVDNNTDPVITLESNKLVISKGAIDLLEVYEDCRIDVKYKKVDKVSVPVIGTGRAFGKEESGNKLTKTNTVSFRGAANDKLAAYGTIFQLEPTETAGVFYLKGDKEPSETKVPEELVNIEEELNVLDTVEIDEDIEFDFNL